MRRTLGITLVAMLAAASVVRGQQDTAVAGILATNEDPISIDSVMWTFFSSPAPVTEITPEWGGSQDIVDTFQFANREEWPLSVTLFYHSEVGGAGQNFLMPVRQDSWYQVIGGADDRAKVIFLDTLLSAPPGIEAPRTSARYPRLRVTASPFVGKTRLTCSVPGRTPARLEVFDGTGQLVRMVFSGVLPAGTHSFDLDAQGLGSGIYLGRLSTPQGRSLVKLARMLSD